MKWQHYKDADGTYRWVEGFDPNCHPDNHGLTIETRLARTGNSKFKNDAAMTQYDEVKTQHTAKVCYGPYGEYVERKTFPFGTNIREVKEWVENHAYLVLGTEAATK